MTETITDVNTSITSDFTNLPSGWTVGRYGIGIGVAMPGQTEKSNGGTAKNVT